MEINTGPTSFSNIPWKIACMDFPWMAFTGAGVHPAGDSWCAMVFHTWHTSPWKSCVPPRSMMDTWPWHT